MFLTFISKGDIFFQIYKFSFFRSGGENKNSVEQVAVNLMQSRPDRVINFTFFLIKRITQNVLFTLSVELLVVAVPDANEKFNVN